MFSSVLIIVSADHPPPSDVRPLPFRRCSPLGFRRPPLGVLAGDVPRRRRTDGRWAPVGPPPNRDAFGPLAFPWPFPFRSPSLHFRGSLPLSGASSSSSPPLLPFLPSSEFRLKIVYKAPKDVHPTLTSPKLAQSAIMAKLKGMAKKREQSRGEGERKREEHIMAKHFGNP